MFLKNKNTKDEGSNRVDTLIGPTASLAADIVVEGNIRIDGRLDGHIDCKGQVIIGETGIIKGTVNCSTMIVYGKMKGNIKCQGLVELMETAELRGDVDMRAIAIKEGALFEGKSMMQLEEIETMAEEVLVS